METFEAISKRVSVREYEPRAVPKALIETIVDAARRAPTARAIEPWEFIVITEKDVLQKLGSIAANNGSFIKEAAACIALYCRDTKYYLEDGSAATENILLEATNNGLGSCWVAGDKKPYAEEVSQLLGVPAGFKLVSLIPLGWPKKEVGQKKSRKLEDVIHWERFQK
ncbi:MAG: nitroreductase family protein [Omnitrophica bacterium]|nr:nitroreductase family protein [Candidatus Omnitrophota bacterium]